jgi:ribosomal protein S18 acetylase RimI-like enzyme
MAEADLPGARSIWAETEGVELAEGDSVEELKWYLQRNPEMSFVAVSDGHIVGAVLAGHDGRRGFIYHLAVAPQNRGAGLGRALVERSLVALKAAAVVRVLILVSRENVVGQTFWSKNGWEPLRFAQPMGLDL